MAGDRCDDVQRLAPELALGIADGEERAHALEHLEGCADCRRELAELAEMADQLLLLTPHRSPSRAFDGDVLSRLPQPNGSDEHRQVAVSGTPSNGSGQTSNGSDEHRQVAVPGTAPNGSRRTPSGSRRLGLAGRLQVVALCVAVAVLTAVGSWWALQGDRNLAAQYRLTLAEAHGTSFGAARLRDAAGREAGVVFDYRGSPSWLLVMVDPRYRSAMVGAQAVSRDGRSVPLREFWLVPSGAWGGSAGVPVRSLAAVELLDRKGRVVLTADLPRA